MVDHPTNGRDTARTRTRVDAALVHASQVARAFGTHCALGATVGRVTRVVRQTRAGGQTVQSATLGVGTAGRWLTGIDGDVAIGWRLFYGND